MKIYQIHEYGGQWEDAYNYIKFTYLDKEKANKKKEELEMQEEIYRKCNSCPLWYCSQDCFDDCSKCLDDNSNKLKRAKEYCNRCDVIIDEDGEVECTNGDSYHEDSYFNIEEVEVIQ